MRNLPGMNNKGEELEQDENWVKKAQNCRFEGEPGTIDKRDPITYFNTTSIGTGAITGLYRYYTSGGVTKFVCIHSTTAYVGDDSAGTWTSIRADLTTGKRMAFETYKDLLICSNGYDNIFVYDGSSDNVTWELGACKAVTAADGTNLDASATYSYKVTIDDDAYVCDAVSNTVTTGAVGGNRKVTLSNIPLGPVGTTNRKIYRTEGGGSSYKLLATLADNTTTTYTDDIADGSLADAYPAVTDDVPKGSILKMHRERLFISGNPSYPNKIYYSNPYLPHYIQQTTNIDYMEVSPDDGDEIMGIPIQLGTMVCVKKNTIRRLVITSAVSGADPATWYAEDPVAFTGSPAQWSIAQTPYGIVMLGWDHWYLFDGSTLKPIIDEFDTREILGATYSDTVCYWHDGVLLAAYTDLEAAGQQHGRVMRYNFKRNKFSYDTIPANCFASKIGDDETGDLFYGDSSNGYVYKDKNSDTLYKLNNKTMCEAGTQSDVFIGGTESSAYIEIGSDTAAQQIPEGVCMFWDNEDEEPVGGGWDEIDGEGRLILINAVTGTTGGDSGHTHNISGTLEMSTASDQDGGDSEGTCTDNNHTHSVSSQASAASSDLYPRYIKWRCYKKNSDTVEYEFPDGAIIMWDQSTAPNGWYKVGTDGYYLRIDDSDLNTAYSSTHNHTFSIVSDAGGDSIDSGGASDDQHHAPTNHTHDISGSTTSTNMDTWELDYAQFVFIKKIGESDTWDGTDKYAYALFDGADAESGGWEDVTSTYTGEYLKIGSSLTTGSAANGSHLHYISPASSDYHNGNGPVYGGYHHQMIERHLHTYTLTVASGSATSAPYRTFRIFRKVLGTMKVYNSAITSSALTSGTWTSPSMQISAQTLDRMYWNEDIESSDNILIHTRTGATKVDCEAAAWSPGLSDPNGSVIASTANVWIQYKIEFTATDTTVSNPRIYMADGYIVKFVYQQGSTNVESSVEFIYQIGIRNFADPLSPKRFKKIATVHEGTFGSFKCQWETDEYDNEFIVDLQTYPKRWESFFHDTATGREIDLTFYKNDNYAFKLKEFKGLYSPLPIMI